MKTTKARAGQAQDAVLASINYTAGPTAGSLRLYTGAAPADLATDPTAGTEVANCALVDGSQAAFGNTNLADQKATGYTNATGFAQDTNATGDNNNDVGYFRIYDAFGAAVLQGTVSAVGGGGELELSSLRIAPAAIVTINTATSTISGII